MQNIIYYIFQIKGCAFQLLNWIARLDSNLSRLMKNSFQVWGSTISLLGIVPRSKVEFPGASMNLIYRLINLELIKTNKVCLFRNGLITEKKNRNSKFPTQTQKYRLKYRWNKGCINCIRPDKATMRHFHWRKLKKFRKKIFVKNSKLFYQIMHQVIHKRELLVI